MKENNEVLYLLAEVLCKIVKFVTHFFFFLCVTAWVYKFRYNTFMITYFDLWPQFTTFLLKITYLILSKQSFSRPLQTYKQQICQRVMMMGNFWLREASMCLVLLALTGALWILPFVKGETCNTHLNSKCC